MENNDYSEFEYWYVEWKKSVEKRWLLSNLKKHPTEKEALEEAFNSGMAASFFTDEDCVSDFDCGSLSCQDCRHYLSRKEKRKRVIDAYKRLEMKNA